MIVVWTPRAARGLRDARTYIAEHDEAAATRLAARLVERADKLARTSWMGRPGRVEGTFEPVVSGTTYIIAYRLSPGQVDILAVLHSRRRWPRHF